VVGELSGGLDCSSIVSVTRIELRFPFLDRSEASRISGQHTARLSCPYKVRSVQRRALRALLPPKIASRTTKGNPEYAIRIAIRDRCEFLRALIENSAACQTELVDSRVLSQELGRARNGLNADIMGLLRFVSRVLAQRNRK